MTNKITVVGMGFVGLTTAAIFASKGKIVYGVDTDAKKIQLISKFRMPFYEPGLESLVSKMLKAKRLIPLGDLERAVDKSNMIFICVGTPMREDGSVNLDYIESASLAIGQYLRKDYQYPVVCVKSTVPPQTTEKVVIPNLQKRGLECGKDFGVAMTPEFLREGSAVDDARRPHLVVVGANEGKTTIKVKRFLQCIYGRSIDILDTNIVSAELIKYANNSFLATKISFINTIANICDRIPGADVDIIARAIGADPRIGSQFLIAGPGYGGSCFPKDVSGFINFCKNIGYEPVLLEATDSVNKRQVDSIMRFLQSRYPSIKYKRITILGTSFKKNTDDIRESVSIKLIERLLDAGAKVRVHDPMALENTKKLLGSRVEYSDRIEDALKDPEVVILMTDWDEYRRINLENLKDTTSRLVIDTRRIMKIREASKIEYIALGRSK